jgi:protoporphyrinogen oxidase
LDIAIIGSGMAGLASARILHDAGHNVTIFEALAGRGMDSHSIDFDGGLIDAPLRVMNPKLWKNTLSLASYLGIDIEEPDNKDKLKAITLPTNTRIIEIPEIIQEKNIGVYNGGLGCYIQKFGTDYFTYKKNLFIYSLFNDEKFKTADFKTIFFINLIKYFIIRK